MGETTDVTQLLQPPLRRHVGQRIEIQERASSRADAIGRNAIARERLAGQWIVRCRQRASRDRRAGEVAGAFGRRRHEARTDRTAILAVPLDVAEEVQLVANDRSADRPAEVVPLQLVLRLVGLFQEVVLRVQRVAAARVEGRAREAVRAGGRDDVDLRAPGAAELGTVVVAEDLEFGDRLERRVHEDRPVRSDVVVVRAVDGPEVGGHIAAADRQVGAAEQPLVLDVEEVRRADARHQRRELQEVAPVQRQLADLLAGDDARDVAAENAHRRRRRDHVDGVLDVAGRELEVDRELVGDAEHDAGARGFLEAGKLGFDLVAADRQIGDGVHTRVVGDRPSERARCPRWWL